MSDQLLAMPVLKLLSMWLLAVVAIGLLRFSSVGAVLKGAPPGFIIQDVGVNTTVSFYPVYLEGSDESVPEVVSASRVRIPGWSRLQHVDKFHHTFRVTIEVASYRTSGSNSRVYVCFDQNPLQSLGECRNGSWRELEKGGSWTSTMSPFEEKYVDIRITKSFSAPSVTISVQDEKSSFRLIFLGMGVILLVMAPIVSGWVPFYYGTAMTLSIVMVVLVILIQGMKLLPTGRKSTLYIVLTGSLAGLGAVVLGYFQSFVTRVLSEMGFSEDMYSPVAVFAGVGIGLLGAWLGFWSVRKFVIAEDGNIDEGIALFVKWTLRIVGVVALFQSSIDYMFSTFAFIGGSVIAWIILNVRVSLLDFWEKMQDYWMSEPVVKAGPKQEAKRLHMTQAQIDAVRRLPGTESLIISKGLVNYPTEGSTPGTRKKRYLKKDEIFPSTFHQSPGLRPPSKQEYADISRECSNKAVDELLDSKEFADWRQRNKHRVVIEPNEHRQERPVEDIELTAFLEEVTPSGGFFRYKKK